MGWGSLASEQRIAIRLLLLGGPTYNVGLNAAAINTRALGRATTATGLAMRTASQRTFLMNQAMFTMRRYAFYGTAAIIGMSYSLIKLGVSFLAAKDSAYAALGPSSGIFKSVGAFNNEFDKLFKLAKFSPFVIGDLVTAFRVMYPTMHLAGLSVGTMNQTMKALVNFMSQAGKTTPRAFNSVSYAIQHMLNQGRLTGRLVQQLSNNGIPMGNILEKMGISKDQLSNISRLNIPPGSILNAIIEFSKQRPFNNAALRISMNSLPGMLQVLRDSLSQTMGIFLSGPYNKFKDRMAGLLGPNGLLNQLSTVGKNRGAGAALDLLSKSLTGTSGVGKGFMLLLSIVRNLATIFARAVVPAFMAALNVLILFAVPLEILNVGLGFLARHAWIVRYALIPLAAAFILTHGAMLGLYVGNKLLSVMLLGQVGMIKKLGIAVFTLQGRVLLMTKATRLWTAATKGYLIVEAGTLAGTASTAAGLTKLERAIITVRTALVVSSKAMWGFVIATNAEKWASIQAGAAMLISFAPILITLAAIAAAIYLIIKYWRQLRYAMGGGIGRSIVGGTGGGGKYTGGGVVGNFLSDKVGAPGWLTGAHRVPGFATGTDYHFGGPALIGEHGPEILNLPRGSQVAPLTSRSVKPIDLSSMSTGDGSPIVVQVMLDRRVLAEAVARDNNDKQARR